MFRGIHHVAIAVRNLSEALDFYANRLGLPVTREATVPDQGVRAALLSVGVDEIELLEPTNPTGGVARFLEKKGEGIHHLCIETDDITAAIAQAKAGNLQLIDQAPRAGLAGSIGFLHPAATQGLLVEMAQPGSTIQPHAPVASDESGFSSMKTVVIGAKDPAALATALARNFGGDAFQEDGPFGRSHEVRIGRSRATVVDAETVGQAAGCLGGKTEGALGICLTAERTALQKLKSRGASVEMGRSGLIWIGGETHGAAVFVRGLA